MRRLFFVAISFFMAFQLTCFADAGGKAGKQKVLDPLGIQRLKSNSSENTKISISDATGGARFIGFTAAGLRGLEKAASVHDRSFLFFQQYGSVFGLKNALTDLKMTQEKSDAQGGKHLSYGQFYFGVPVFAGVIKTHFDAAGQLRAVNGNIIPEINVNPHPSKRSEDAAATALAMVINDKGADKSISVRNTILMIYRTGLAQGIPGQNHLVWEVEVGNGANVREFVYIDAHTGKFVDQITGIVDAMFRRAYNGNFLPEAQVPTFYPGSPFWVEGQPFPTGNTEADNMILASKDTYDFYSFSFGRDSFDGLGGIMDSIFNRGYGCPNASWNGTFISFCNGLTTDDVTGHEWSHAYTQYTHGLIYAWQPGALNESYSDIFGETIDRINGRMTDTPNTQRTDGACSAFTQLPPTVTINSPAAIAGVKPAGIAQFGPTAFTVTNDVVLANDGVATGQTLSDGCCAGPSFVCAANSWTNAADVAGKFALVDRGTCGFAVKVKNAQVNGAVGVIVANNAAGIINMGGVDATITVPSLLILQSDGNAIKTQLLSNTVNATLSRGATGPDNSVRWLLGEDDTAVGLSGALRDMWWPNCYNNPGKVTDTQYGCGTGDSGGVHNNSGVPNHAYALTVDGGTYNGQTINGIGLTKAAHIYFRAETVYQHPTTDFVDHADAIEQSATDLIGVDLPDLNTGAPSGQIITIADVAEVQKAMLAVQMRTLPTQCNFQPLLGQNPPADPSCGAGTAQHTLFADDFEGNTSGWTATFDAVGAGYSQPDWVVSTTLPDGRAGQAFFGADLNIGGCNATDNESGVRHLTSPVIAIPPSLTSTPTLTFDHWVATEAGFDGGQLMISVNGGPFTLVPQANFIYNGYNATFAAAPGNTNPRAGQRAWSGTDGGEVDGTWGKSIVNLAGLVAAGDSIQLRWDISTDGCGGTTFGWYVDNVRVYDCEPQLSALSPAKVWIGLKNSDDVGTNFDLLAEVLQNGTVVGSGQINNVPGGSSGFNNAVLRTINLALSTLPAISSGDTVSFRLSVRITAVGGHRSGTARLWYDGKAIDSGATRDAGSRFDATIGSGTADYFLRGGFLLDTTAGTSRKFIDVFVDRAKNGNPFIPFGTWSKTF